MSNLFVPMHINPVHLLDCLEKVDGLAEAYRLHVYPNGDGARRSIDELLKLYNGTVQRPTTLVELPLNHVESPTWGMFLKKSDGTAEVVFAAGLGFEWQRFVICKELMHGLLDNDGYHDMDMAKHVERMCLDFPDDDSRPPVTVQVEFLAEIAAMEFLFPYAARQHVIQNSVPFSSVAQTYGVPLRLVETYCADTYMRHLSRDNIRAL